MVKIDNFARHSELLQKMASTLGADLGQAVLTDRLGYFPFQDMVYRCSKCPKVDACENWLQDHASGATETPDYCRNKHLLEGLREDA